MLQFKKPKTVSALSLFLILIGLMAVAPRTEAQDLYWTVDGPTIMGANKDGTNIVQVFDGTGMAGTAVEVIATETHIYWTDKNDTAAGGVWRANRDGSEATLFVTNPNDTMWAPQYIAVDEENDALYFSCYFTGMYSADLVTGGEAVWLGRPDNRPIDFETPDYPTTTGLAVRGSNELISVSGANNGMLNSTNITNKTHSQIGWLTTDGGNHGLAYDSETDTIYFASTAGILYSYNIPDHESTPLMSSLSLPLGVGLSTSKTHLLYVERNADRISAYDLLEPANSFEMITDQGAWFGVSIWGDPQAEPDLPPPDPIDPGTELVHDDFSTGTVGNNLSGSPETGSETSDGKGRWVTGAGRAAVYGGTEANKSFRTNGSQLSYVFLTTNADAAENFSVVLDNVTISTDILDGGSSFLFGARRSGVELGWAYDFRPVAPAADPTNKIWEVSYIRDEGALQKVIVGHIQDEVLNFASLELRVLENRVRLYIDGEPFDNTSRPTQGTMLDNVTDHVLHIGLNSTSSDTLTLEFDEVTATVIEAVEQPTKRRLFVYDDFDYPTGDLVGQDGGSGWSQPWVESRESNATDWPIPQVASPGQTFGDLLVEGNKANATDGGRAFRSIDTSGINPEQLNADGNIGKPGTSAWISFIADGNSDDADPNGPNRPFWGLAFFRDNTERLFFGKSTGGTGLRLSAQGGAQQFDDAINVGDKHFIVLRLDFNEEGGHAATLFHNPDPMGRTPTDEDALGVYTGEAFEMAFNRVRVAGFPGPGGTIDELRIGATWADVTPVPFNGLVNGDLEEEPFTRGWSVSDNVLEHAGFAPDSTKAAYIRRDADLEGSVNLIQNLPNWIETIIPPRFDPVTGEPMGNRFISTGPEWQLGFYTVVSDPLGNANRSLNVAIGHDVPDPEQASDVNSPQINFRITGDGGAQSYHGGGLHPDHPAGSGWQNVFPAGTFTFSPLNGDMAAATGFTETTPFYLQFDGDYSGENPSYTVSARRAGETEFFAVSSPISAWQYLSPTPGQGITRVRFHGAVNSPYAVDAVHLITTGDPAPEGFASWQEQHFGAETDPSIIGEDADSDGDGIPNLLEYAFGSNPVLAGRTALPAQSVQEIGGEDYLTVTITRPIGLADVDYEVNESADLENWAGTAVSVGSPTDNGNGTESILYRSSEPVSSESRWFLEVRVNRIELE